MMVLEDYSGMRRIHSPSVRARIQSLQQFLEEQ